MILDKKETVIAYRCPKCGNTIASIIGVFSLSGDMIKLKCSCKHSEITMTYTKDKKIVFKIPCLFCGTEHTYTVSKESFFEKGLLTLDCPYTGLAVGFMGKKDPVFEEIKKSDEELKKILGEYEPDDLVKANSKNTDTIDAQVYDIVNFMLNELEDDGKIKCGCEGKGDYAFCFEEDGVVIFCRDCGKKKAFNLESVQRANDFLDTDLLILE